MSYLLYLMFRCNSRCDGCDGKFGNFVGTKHTLCVLCCLFDEEPSSSSQVSFLFKCGGVLSVRATQLCRTMRARRGERARHRKGAHDLRPACVKCALDFGPGCGANLGTSRGFFSMGAHG